MFMGLFHLHRKKILFYVNNILSLSLKVSNLKNYIIDIQRIKPTIKKYALSQSKIK